MSFGRIIFNFNPLNGHFYTLHVFTNIGVKEVKNAIFKGLSIDDKKSVGQEGDIQ